jgi:hypothetical protein
MGGHTVRSASVGDRRAARMAGTGQRLNRRLQQVLTGFLAAGEQHGRAQQVIGALGQEALELSRAPVGCHPVLLPGPQTKHEEPGGNVPSGSKISRPS